VTKTTTLKTFNADTGRRRALAAALGVGTDYVWQLGVRYRGKRPGTDRAKEIEQITARIWRRVPKESLRPDVWGTESKHGE
jgi:hypothetical protein